MNSIVHIAHTTIQFPQNNDTFLYRFSYLVKSPKNASIFCGFCAIWRSYKVVIIVTKDLQKKVKFVTVPEKKTGHLPTFFHNSIYTYISIYTYKGAAK